jgi:predicted ATP-grasp superfamily ATP-dependent carboligase
MSASSNKRITVLVLDADHKNALAIIRHLGKTKQYEIDVVSHNKRSIGFYSKYANEKILVHDPKKDANAYLNDLLGILIKKKYAVILPVSYISYQICSENKEKISEHTHLTITSHENIKLASSKVQTYAFAEKIAVPYPAIIKVNSLDEIESLDPEFPCVIKAPFEIGKNVVDYAHNKEQFIRKYRAICDKHNMADTLPIVQRYIDGGGFGFFAYYENGQCKNFFIHKRLREYPASGGFSTTAEAFYDPKIETYGKKILDALNWDGVAMVEFKQDKRTGEYYLMEINAKFWGSLELALVNGVNFPQMLIDRALGKDVKTNDSYGRKRFQWILNGDLFHLFQRPWHLFAFIRDLFIARNDFYWSDIKPNLYQVANIFVHYFKRWFK